MIGLACLVRHVTAQHQRVPAQHLHGDPGSGAGQHDVFQRGTLFHVKYHHPVPDGFSVFIRYGGDEVARRTVIVAASRLQERERVVKGEGDAACQAVDAVPGVLLGHVECLQERLVGTPPRAHGVDADVIVLAVREQTLAPPCPVRPVAAEVPGVGEAVRHIVLDEDLAVIGVLPQVVQRARHVAAAGTVELVA